MNDIAEISTEISSLLNDAYGILSPITEHDDWNCRERDTINERILDVKRAGKSLSETAVSLSSAFRNIAEIFTEMENSTPFDLSDAVAGFGSALSEPYSSYESNVGSAGYAACAEAGVPVITKDMSSSYEAVNILSPLEIVKVR